MSFRVSNKQFLSNYDKIWEKNEKLMSLDFESKVVYGDDEKYIKTKIKMYEDSMITNVHNNKVPKEKTTYKCASVIMLDSVIKSNKKSYPQKFLAECKYVQQKRIILMRVLNQIVTPKMKQNQIATQMIKQNVILIMMNKLKKLI